jgi:hypothetical protein
MSYNLIFNGIEEDSLEDTEEVLHNFLNQELGIDFHFEFKNVHRFGKKNRKNRKQVRPIVAKFIYQKDVSFVLENARKLKGKPYRINRQFPEEIEQARKSLYPVMKELRQRGEHVKLVRDTLYVNGEPYCTESDTDTRQSPRRIESTPNVNRAASNKRRQTGSTPTRR